MCPEQGARYAAPAEGAGTFTIAPCSLSGKQSLEPRLLLRCPKRVHLVPCSPVRPCSLLWGHLCSNWWVNRLATSPEAVCVAQHVAMLSTSKRLVGSRARGHGDLELSRSGGTCCLGTCVLFPPREQQAGSCRNAVTMSPAQNEHTSSFPGARGPLGSSRPSCFSGAAWETPPTPCQPAAEEEWRAGQFLPDAGLGCEPWWVTEAGLLHRLLCRQPGVPPAPLCRVGPVHTSPQDSVCACVYVCVGRGGGCGSGVDLECLTETSAHFDEEE